MFRPEIQKTRILIAMATVTMLTIFWVANSIEYIPADNIQEKMIATKKMSEYIESINTISEINSKNDSMYVIFIVFIIVFNF